MKKIVCLFLIVFTSVILWKCASQTTPTGGPKDETPPTLRKSVPANNETNFKGKEIELTFDELLQLNNPKEEIIITPSPGKDVVFLLKQNKVIIEPKAGWADSTTYSITFREGVKDMNEGNSVEDLHLAFSTGPTIDSLQITGKITESLTEKIPEKITVALYLSDTFNIFEHNPSFFTKTKPDGSFKLENLKAGEYFLYAFDDKNKNLKVESKNEKFGFLPQPIRPSSLPIKKKTDTLTLPLYQLDSRPLKLNSIRNTGTVTQIRLNKELVTYQILNPDKAKIHHSFAQNQSEITIYNELEINDSTQIRLQGTDSTRQKIDTTFFIKRIESKLPKEKFNMTIASASIDPKTYTTQVQVLFTKPIQTINLDSIYFTPDAVTEKTIKPKLTSENKKEQKQVDKGIQDKKNSSLKQKRDTTSITTDSLTQKQLVKIPVTAKDIIIDSIRKTLTIIKTIDKTLITKTVKQINVVLEPAFLTSIENDSSSRAPKSMPIADLETTGVLHIEVTTTHKNYEIQLLTTNGNVIQKVRNVKKYTFEYLPPQEYKLLILVDLNNNGLWDSHNIYERKQQEPSFFYKTQEGKFTFPIRAAWELGPLVLKF